jgi:flagellar basal-body rod protein FlgF
MDRGLYIAASGMLAEQVRQDMLANDLANVSTPGYKGDRPSQRAFGELLVANSRGAPVGTIGAGSRITGQTTAFEQAAIQETDEPLDLAITGDGWFAVRTPQGERYTRGGRFAALPDGTLGDQLGNPVLGPDRQPVRVRPDGSVDPAAVGVFAVQRPLKAGEGLVTGTPAGPGTGTVRAGALEASGVNATQTMVSMLQSTRTFEAGQKVLQTIDGTLELAARQVGGLPS